MQGKTVILRVLALLVCLLGATARYYAEPAPSTQPTQPAGAAVILLRAATLIKVNSPAASNLGYASYPPFPPAWHQMAEAAWVQNKPVRDLVRQARSIDEVTWPSGKHSGQFSATRALTLEVGDAAIYEHLHGNDAAAVESLLDLLHIADLIEKTDINHEFVACLVVCGIRSSAMYRLMLITSNVVLTDDTQNTTHLRSADAKALIAQLLVERPEVDYLPILQHDNEKAVGTDLHLDTAEIKAINERYRQTLLKAETEKKLAAMSLACHLFRFEKHRWPAFLSELTPAYLPRIPLDPWGDGTETLGYVLVKDGLPGGGDRPQVFCRCEARDGLFYRIDEPEYGFYIGDGTNRTYKEQRKGGQFRDVARWAPGPKKKGAPTTRPLNDPTV